MMLETGRSASSDGNPGDDWDPDRAYLMTTVGSAYKVEPPTGTAFMPVGGGVGSRPCWLHRAVLECDRPALSS